jgi:predicted ATPase
MYIQQVDISHIRSIERFRMTFEKPAGWHVVIGDNGSGKSTVIRSLALAMLNVAEVNAARQNWDEWLQRNQEFGTIDVLIAPDKQHDAAIPRLQNRVTFQRLSLHKRDNSRDIEHNVTLLEIIFRGRKVFDKNVLDSPFSDSASLYTGMAPPPTPATPPVPQNAYLPAWFSVAYGPFRRFTGGSEEKEKLFKTNPHLGAHLSAFGEDVALTEALAYLGILAAEKFKTILKDQNRLEQEFPSKTPPLIHPKQLLWAIFSRNTGSTLDHLQTFINQADLLPHGTMIETIDLEGVLFRDGNGHTLNAIELSDGYRSVLSLMFELIRQLIRSYGAEQVFATIAKGGKTIDLPGVVMIDEIDAHLHPTWQTRIGQWFTDCFPNLQFIVTTHSPLVCRAAEKGSIWRLAAPGSGQESGEVTGLERDRLIYGNVLDAYGTEVFGRDVERSKTAKEKLQRLAHLGQLSTFGRISEPEKEELNYLSKIFTTDDPTEF